MGDRNPKNKQKQAKIHQLHKQGNKQHPNTGAKQFQNTPTNPGTTQPTNTNQNPNFNNQKWKKAS